MDNQHASPIFIHSLFRSGSTWLFNVFRRSEAGYWCYQEPLNEKLLQKAARPGGLLESIKGVHKLLRHPQLDKPYTYEFHVVADAVVQHFHEALAYEQFFSQGKDDLIELKTYFTALQNGAQGRPVLQCCRTTGRVAGLKSECAGIHLFLWRNPWDQWWSYKKDHYFDSRNLLISDAKHLPAFLQALKRELQIREFPDANAAVKHAYLTNRRLESSASYQLFYALWCHAMLEARPHCDLSINIDRLSNSNAYRDEILEKLNLLGVAGLDFTDCAVPMAGYGESDGAFFLEAEDHVHALLTSHGYSDEQVQDLIQLSAERQQALADTSAPENSAIRDAMRAREYLRQAESTLVETQNMLFNVRAQALQAEARAKQAEARAERAQSRTREAE